MAANGAAADVDRPGKSALAERLPEGSLNPCLASASTGPYRMPDASCRLMFSNTVLLRIAWWSSVRARFRHLCKGHRSESFVQLSGRNRRRDTTMDSSRRPSVSKTTVRRIAFLVSVWRQHLVSSTSAYSRAKGAILCEPF